MATPRTLKTAEDATTLAQAFATHLEAGDCLLLSGPVGAGKTHFARGIIHALTGTTEDVPSPTFTLVQTYDTPKGEVWHADLYRLCHIDELVELGLEDAFESAITLVEWPDRLGTVRPARCLELDFAIPALDSEDRILTINPHGDGWEWLASLPA